MEDEVRQENNINAFRLSQRVRVGHLYRKSYYNVTITPKGEHKTHEILLKEIVAAVGRYRCVLDVFLIAESQNTNHFHGVFVCKDTCKFLRLYNKKNPFHFHIKTNLSLNDWCRYCVKHNPTSLWVYNSEIVRTYGYEYFNKPFVTDKELAHYSL